MLRCALVGISGYGREYLRLLALPAVQPRLKLVAAVAVNAAEEAELCGQLRAEGVALFDSLEALLAAGPELELCILPVPIHLHTAMAEACLRASYRVLLEKPACASVAELDRLSTVEAETGRSVTVGFQYPSAPEARAAQAWLQAGRLGRIESLQGLVFWPRPQSYYARNRWAGRRTVDGQPVHDSPFANATAHFFHLLLSLAVGPEGEGLRVASGTAELYRAQGRGIENFDTAYLRLVGTDGTALNYLTSHSTRLAWGPRLEIVGAGGRILHNAEGLCLLDASGRCVEALPGSEHNAVRDTFFLRCIAFLEGDGENPVPLASTREHVRLIEALAALEIGELSAEAHATGADTHIWVPHLEEHALAALARGCHLADLPLAEARVPHGLRI